MKKILIGFLFLLLSSGCFTQTIDTLFRFETYYALNSDEISWDLEHSLDLMQKKLIYPSEMYYVDITGYSDQVGNPKKNARLAASRAENVALYFQKNNFDPERVRHKGSYIPEKKDTTENGDQRQRKVQIIVTMKTPVLPPLPDITEKESFSIRGDLGDIITTSSGTTLFIPSDAFNDSQGNSVNGKIRFVYREYRDTISFLSRGVPMNNPNDPLYLNSTGMFELEAWSGKTKLNLKPSKKIELFFGLNKRMPLLDLYYYADSIQKWTFKEHLTNEYGKVDDVRYRESCCGCRNVNFCDDMDRCTRLSFLVNEGLKYAESELTITEQMKILNDIQQYQIKPLEEKRNELRKKSNILHQEMKLLNQKLFNTDSLVYKIERIDQSALKTIFHIRCDAAEKFELAPLADAQFRIRGSVPDSLFKVEWDSCKLSRSGNKYTILLMLNGEKQKLSNLKMKPLKQGETTFWIKKIYPAYKKKLKEHNQYTALIKDSVAKKKAECLVWQLKLVEADSLLEIEYRKWADNSLIELNCLWKLSRAWMSAQEKKLSYDDWIVFFDANKKQMKQWYLDIKNNSQEAEYCLEQAKRKERYMYKVYEVTYPKALKPSSSDTLQTVKAPVPRDTVIVPLSISRLGLYNTATRTYQEEIDKNKIRISYYYSGSDSLLISRFFIVSESLNSLTEVHSDHYSPYLFPMWSPDPFRIIAFDERGRMFFSRQLTKEELSRKPNQNAVELILLHNLEQITPFFPRTKGK